MLNKGKRGRIAAFLAVFCLAVLIYLFPNETLHLHNPNTYLYIGLIIAWALSIRRRIIRPEIRRPLMGACVFMALLFLLRLLRWDYFSDFPAMDEFSRIAYYLSFVMTPLLLFLAANRGGQAPKQGSVWLERILWLLGLMLCAGILTNPIHNRLLRFIDLSEAVIAYGWLYYVVVCWAVLLTCVMFGILLHRCRLSTAKRLWYVPALSILLGGSLLLLYFICGGSPMIGGIKLYNLQEVFCALYIFTFESIIQIGLIPSNSAYRALFERSGIQAIIQTADEVAADPSMEWNTPDSEQRSLRFRCAQISGGRVVWWEDLSVIEQLNAELARVIEELEEESELIRQENELQAARISFETKNRIYDRVAAEVRPQVLAMEAVLQDGAASEQEARDRLVYATILGAFVKRLGNLMLLESEQETISVKELCLSIEESQQYLSLSGRTCHLSAYGDAQLPSKLVILAYELFEAVLERAYPTFCAYGVAIQTESGFCMTLALDLPEFSFPENWQAERCAVLNMHLSLWQADDTAYVQLRTGKGAAL